MLPPSLPALKTKIQRVQYVTVLWTRAITAFPEQGLSPADYGWHADNNILKPTWFEGPAIPDCLFTNDDENSEEMEDNVDSDSEEETIDELMSDSDEAWSEESDSGEEPGDDVE